MTTVEYLAREAKMTWFDAAGVVLGVGLTVAYFSAGDSPRSTYLLYAGLVVLATHAYISMEVLPRRKRVQEQAVEIAVAYREVLKTSPPSGMESRNGQHPPYHRGQPAPSRIAV